MFVLGTAGHIDHGKSVLVHALTGIDPDRLSEEKERGMTIDLGFAWMKLPSGREVGIVDVPGHERFVRNMLAGVGGIDLALLVIAANEGVMPQTREHLAILDLLEIRQGVVAITKKDLVDEELLSLVRMEIEELLAPTTLAGAFTVAVSALTGEGLPELISAIDGLLESIIPRKDMERARLPIDRVFTMTGSGTVVTGTLIDGSLSIGQEVEIAPAGIKSRLRGLQMHKSRIDVAQPGSRIAANLVGVATTQLHRGDVVVRPGWLKPTTVVSAHFRLLAYQRRPLRHNARLSFYSGSAEAIAKVRLLEADELKPGEAGWIQLMLDRPVAVVNGDHFIIRSSTDTLGGGRITDVHAKRLRRFRSSVIQALEVRERGSSEEVLLSLLEARQPLLLSSLASTSDLPAAEVESVLVGLIEQGRVVSTGQSESRLLFSEPGWQKLIDKTVGLVREYHNRFPARAGMPRVELGNKLTVKAQSPAIIAGLIKQGIVIEEGLNVRLPEHRVQLTPAQQAQADVFLKSLKDNPYAPPADLIPEADILSQLVAQHEVVKVAEGVVFSTKAYDEMVELVTSHIKTQGKVTLAEVRDMLQTSRKYTQAFLEYLDSKKITRRVGDERILY
ncbi:MAG: selenocysteine-specific translation elongation factor [Dehalococcoidales bacterium]|nr:MAG: selenocysteine-specific translation elongation factor [Dehalococcoidales bacterium]